MGGAHSEPLQQELGRLLVTSSSMEEVCNYARGFLGRDLSLYEQRLIQTQISRIQSGDCSVPRGAAEVARVLRYFKVKTVVAARDTENFDAESANQAEESALGRRGENALSGGTTLKSRLQPSQQQLPRLRASVEPQEKAPEQHRVKKISASDVARARARWRSV